MEKVKSKLSPYRLFAPQIVGLVTAINRKGKPNVAPISLIAWTEIFPHFVTIHVMPERYTHECLIHSNKFVLNPLTIELVDQVLFCGSHSGRDTDKFKKTGLTQLKSELVAAPRIGECVTHIECTITSYFRTELHTIFLGKVLAQYVEEEVINDEHLDLVKSKPLLHLGKNTYATIEKLLIKIPSKMA